MLQLELDGERGWQWAGQTAGPQKGFRVGSGGLAGSDLPFRGTTLTAVWGVDWRGQAEVKGNECLQTVTDDPVRESCWRPGLGRGNGIEKAQREGLKDCSTYDFFVSGLRNDACLLKMRACSACLLSRVFICVPQHVKKMHISFKASSWMQ